LSKIIKAAQLQVLVTSPKTTIFRSEQTSELQPKDQVIMNSSIKSEETILKATQLIEEANAKAADIIRQAQEQAMELVQSAQQKKAEIEEMIDHMIQLARDEGYQAGYQDGLNQGTEEVRNRCQQLLTTLEAVVDAAVAARSSALNRLEEDFLKLGIYIAEKLIKREINQDPAWLLPTIRAALEQLATHDWVTIRVNPSNYHILSEMGNFTDIYTGKLHWESDPSLGPHDCLIENEFGAIDASLEHRFAKLKNALEEQIYVEK